VDSSGPLTELDGRELEALRGAATWYAKYHAPIIAEQADEESAYAVARREEYLDLVRALAKLGVRLRVPDSLAKLETRAA